MPQLAAGGYRDVLSGTGVGRKVLEIANTASPGISHQRPDEHMLGSPSRMLERR